MIPVSIKTPSFSHTIPLSHKAMQAVYSIIHSGCEGKPGYSLSYQDRGMKASFQDVPPKAIEYIIQVHQAGGFV